MRVRVGGRGGHAEQLHFRSLRTGGCRSLLQYRVALVQSRHDNSEFPTPAAAGHASLGSDTVDVLKDLLDKATRQATPRRTLRSGTSWRRTARPMRSRRRTGRGFSAALAAEEADLPVTGQSLLAEEASQVASGSSVWKEELKML